MPSGKKANRFAPRSQWGLLVGLTGGLGSGKSTVLAQFRKNGFYTLDADRVVHDLLNGHGGVKNAVRRKFGSDVIDSKGKVDRRKLASIVFPSPKKRRELEKIIHPLVRKEFKRALLKRKGKEAVLDIPLLFESGWAPRLDATVVVWAGLNMRVSRLKKRGMAPSEARRRMKAQQSLLLKKKKADYVINNNGSLAQTKIQVDGLIKKLRTGLFRRRKNGFA